MVSIFCEGILDEAVLRRIISEKTNMEVGVAVSKKGKSYIKQKSPSLNKSALGSPIIALADLDQPTPCLASLIATWLEGNPRSSNFLLRFAVLQIEAWLLADRKNISKFLSISEARIPKNPETICCPKLELISLARYSTNRHIRESLIPDRKSGAIVGPNYNSELSKFVASSWDIDSAAEQSRSLSRTVTRITELASRLKT